MASVEASLQLFDEVIDVPVVVRHGFRRAFSSLTWFVQFLDKVDMSVIVQRQVLGSRQYSTLFGRLQVQFSDKVVVPVLCNDRFGASFDTFDKTISTDFLQRSSSVG